MNASIPKKLRTEPLLEALWEVRFTSDDPMVGEVLPGLLFQSLRTKYPSLKRLNAADIPRPIAEVDPNLRFQPTVRLLGPPFSIQIGTRVISVSCTRPYAGWSEFSARIIEAANALHETGLANRPERFSLKYIDLLEIDATPSLGILNLKINVSGHDLKQQPVHLRTEIRDNSFVHVLQIISPARANIEKEEPVTGVLIDIDTVSFEKPTSFWDDLESRINIAHDRSKKLFFDLLTEDTLEKLEPEYEG